MSLDKNEIKEKLGGHEPSSIQADYLIPAAVLMPLFEKHGRWHALFTLRSPDLPTHQNQISFPGGKVDKGESLLQAALREAEEEVGIKPGDVDVLGRLDDITTITKFIITPFVGVIPYPYDFKVSEKEIAEIIELPLEAFLDHSILRKDNYWQFQGKPYPVYYFNTEKHTVWGATARILKQFLELVLDWEDPE